MTVSDARDRLRRAVAPWVGHFASDRALADALPTNATAVVGCSGGADSLALLALAVAADLQVVAVHVDHRLRPSSLVEAEHVAAISASIGIDCRKETAEVSPGSNLEDRARRVRYQVLEDAADRVDATAILIGHTMDDQAETVLLQLMRGSGRAGLGGMPIRRGRVVRPILGLRRADTIEICSRLQWSPVDDSMNHDRRFQRVWVRRELLPMLERAADRDLQPVLARQAAILREESTFLDQLADDALTETREQFPHESDAALPLSSLRDAAPVLARRMIRRWLGDPPASASDVDAVLGVVRLEGAAVDLSNGRRVERRRGTLVRLLRVDEMSSPSIALVIPGVATGGPWRVESWIERAAPVRWPADGWTVVLDADRVPQLVLHPTPSSAIARSTDASTGHSAPVITGESSAGESSASEPCARESSAIGPVLWAPGYGCHASVRVSSSTTRYLWLQVSAMP